MPDGRTPSCTVALPVMAEDIDLPKDFTEFASANKFDCLSLAMDDPEKLTAALAPPTEAVSSVQRSPRGKNKGRKAWRFLFRLSYTHR
jgi:hypothetical protein